MPKRKARPKAALDPEELVSILDEHFTRGDPDESERAMAEFFRRPEPRIEDLFPPEEIVRGKK